MKNSPHHRRHMQHKAIQAAVRMKAETKETPTNIPFRKNFLLKPLNTNISIKILQLYKKHLEGASLYKEHPDTTQKKSTRYAAHWASADLERSKRVARKMLKESHRYHKKAA
jgi:hypothetical protein